MATRKLNPREEEFILEYLIDWDHQRAALAAGYPNKYWGTKLLKLQRIWNVIAEERELRRERLRVDADRVTEEFAKIAYSNARDYVPKVGQHLDISRLDIDKTAAIEHINIEDVINPRTGDTHRKMNLKLHDKVGALNSLAKSIGMLTERHIHEGTIEFAISQLSPEERIARVRQLQEKAKNEYLPAYEQAARTIEGQVIDRVDGGGLGKKDEN